MLAGADNEQPLIFNRIAIGLRFDTDRKRVLLTQADISNGEIGIAGIGLATGRRMHAEGPGSISDGLFWLRDGALVRLPHRVEDGRLVFAPPDEFLDVLYGLDNPVR